MIQWMLAIWSLVPLSSLKPGWTSGSSWFMYYWSLWCVQLWSCLNIFWHCLSLGLEWKMTFSSPVATAEFSKFSGILSATLSHHHFSGQNTGVGSLSLFQGIVPTQGLKPGLPHWRRILYQLSHNTVSCYFSSGQFSCSVVSDFATPWIAACQASLSIANSQSLLKLMSIQPSHPLSSPSPPALNLSQHQGLFQSVNSLHEVAKVLEFQL